MSEKIDIEKEQAITNQRLIDFQLRLEAYDFTNQDLKDRLDTAETKIIELESKVTAARDKEVK